MTQMYEQPQRVWMTYRHGLNLRCKQHWLLGETPHCWLIERKGKPSKYHKKDHRIISDAEAKLILFAVAHRRKIAYHIMDVALEPITLKQVAELIGYAGEARTAGAA